MQNRRTRRAIKSQDRKVNKRRNSHMRKQITIPIDVADVDLQSPSGKPFTAQFQVFLREHVLGWTGFDDSTDMLKVSNSIKSKFEGKSPKSKIVITETEWEKGKKALEAANIPAHLRAVLRPFRLAWLEAEDIDTEAVAAEKPNGEPTAALQREQ